MLTYIKVISVFFLLTFNSVLHAQELSQFDKDSTLIVGAVTGNIQLVKEALSLGANVNVRGAYNMTPLYFVVDGGGGNQEIVKALINAGADVNVKNNYGVPVLMVAILRNDIETIKTLIKAGANVNIRDRTGWTPLMWATKLKRNEVYRILMNAGADKNAETYFGESVTSLSKLYPDDKSSNTGTIAITDLAKYYFKEGKHSWEFNIYHRAIEYFSKAIYYNPKYAAAYYWRGLAYKEAKNITLAQKDFEKACSLDKIYCR